MVADLSTAGVRLSGDNLPDEGELLEVKIDQFTSFGTVVWRKDSECGVAFDPPLSESAVETLRSRAGKANLANMSVEERVALEEWLLGGSR